MGPSSGLGQGESVERNEKVKMIKAQVVSDLHSEFFESKRGYEDIIPVIGNMLILCGDIGNISCSNYSHFFEWASSVFKYVIYVPGNHEFYGHEIYRAKDEMKSFFSKIPNVYFLDKSSISIENINFVGSTLWTNPPKSRTGFRRRMRIQKSFNDYKKIKVGKEERNLNIYDTIKFHEEERSRIREELEKCRAKNQKLFVVSHHCPILDFNFLKNSEKRHRDIIYFRCSDLSSLFLSYSDVLGGWFCGHTHKSQLAECGDIMVISNQVGYAHEKGQTGYRKDLVINIRKNGLSVSSQIDLSPLSATSPRNFHMYRVKSSSKKAGKSRNWEMFDKKTPSSEDVLEDEEKVCGIFGFVDYTDVLGCAGRNMDFDLLEENVEGVMVNMVLDYDRQERVAKIITCAHVLVEEEFPSRRDDYGKNDAKNSSTETISCHLKDTDTTAVSLGSCYREKSYGELDQTIHKILCCSLDLCAPELPLFGDTSTGLDYHDKYFFFLLPTKKPSRSEMLPKYGRIFSLLLKEVNENIKKNKDSRKCEKNEDINNIDEEKINFEELKDYYILPSTNFLIVAMKSNCFEVKANKDMDTLKAVFYPKGELEYHLKGLPKVSFEREWDGQTEATVFSHTLGSFCEMPSLMKKGGCFSKSGFASDLDSFGEDYLRRRGDDWMGMLKECRLEEVRRLLGVCGEEFYKFLDVLFTRVGDGTKYEESVKAATYFSRYHPKSLVDQMDGSKHPNEEEEEGENGVEEETSLSLSLLQIVRRRLEKDYLSKENLKEVYRRLQKSSEKVIEVADFLLKNQRYGHFSLALDYWHRFLAARHEFYTVLLDQIEESIGMYQISKRVEVGGVDPIVHELHESFNKAKFMSNLIFSFDELVSEEGEEGVGVMRLLKRRIPGIHEWKRTQSWLEIERTKQFYLRSKQVGGNSCKEEEIEEVGSLEDKFLGFLQEKYGYRKARIVTRKVLIGSRKKCKIAPFFGLVHGVVASGDTGAMVTFPSKEPGVVNIVGMLGWGKLSISLGMNVEYFFDYSSKEWKEFSECKKKEN